MPLLNDFRMVLTAIGKYALRLEDGTLVVPIGCLKHWFTAKHNQHKLAWHNFVWHKLVLLSKWNRAIWLYFVFYPNYVNISKIARVRQHSRDDWCFASLGDMCLRSPHSPTRFVGTPIIEPKFVERYITFYRAKARINTILLNATPSYTILHHTIAYINSKL